MSKRLPIAANVDILVVGSSSAAVQFALAATTAGRSVMVVSGHPYLGDDICADYRFWLGPDEHPETDLAAAVFGHTTTPPTPMHVKLTLEQALVEAGVGFLLNSHPAGVLRTGDGRVGGAVIGNRAGRHAFRARLVVDATCRAQVSKQAGRAVLPPPHGRLELPFVAIGNWPDDSAPGDTRFVPLPGWSGSIADTPYCLHARRYMIDADLGDGSFRARLRAAADIVDRIWTPETYLHQERLYVPDTTHAAAAREPTLTDLTVVPGLIRLGHATGLSDGATAVFNTITGGMAAARRLGGAAAAALPPAAADVHLHCADATPVAEGTVRGLDRGLRPADEPTTAVVDAHGAVPRLGAFDVVVVGGGTGGAPAAIGAARAGADVLVVESTAGLGGVGTMGQISVYYFGNRRGFTAEVDAGVAKLETEESLRRDDQRWSVQAKKAWYHRQCHGRSVVLAYGSTGIGAWVCGSRVRGVLIAGPEGYGLVEAGCVVDATGCADVAAAAGAPTVNVGAEHVAVQGTGLAALDPSRQYHNTDHNFSDDTDVVDATAFLVSSKLKFRDHFDAQQLVDSRERRQIIGDVQLSPLDCMLDHRFHDTICVATSNFDTHGFTVHPVFWVRPPGHDQLWVDLPFRAMLPQGLDGVIVTGLALSAHRDALPVIRMQADVQNHGYAAGRAAATSARTGEPLRRLDVRELQRHLVAIGNLPARVLTDTDSAPFADAVLARAIDEQWNQPLGVALMFADPARAQPRMAAAFTSTDNADAQLQYALCLALQGDPTGVPRLAEHLNTVDWDDGWNYRGMGQFGLSLSPVDVMLVALGSAGDASVWELLLNKIRALPEPPAFSHCRAVVLACERLYARHPHPGAAAALANLLKRPGMTNHGHPDLHAVQAAITPDPCENNVRNAALRELLLARGILRCGDHQGLGQNTLLAYAADMRGHFSRHARALLAEANGRTPG